MPSHLRHRARFVTSAVFCVAAGLTLHARQALAEPEAAAAQDEATKLFEEGRALSATGNYPAACEKFERSAALSDGVGIKFNLADCFEHLGRNKSARDLFVEVAATTRQLGQTKRERAALARAGALDAKMARLSVDARTAGPELRVSLDGKELTREELNQAIDVDPGEHELLASAEGNKPWSFRVTVPNGPSNVVIVVPALEAEPAKAIAVRPRPGPSPRKGVDERQPPREGPVEAQSGSSPRRTLSLVLGGVGAAGVVGGGYMAVRYLQNHEDSKVICPTSRGCTDAEIRAHTAFVDEAKTARTWSFVGFGVGGAALIGAAYLFFIEPNTGASVQATPVVGPDGSLGGALSARF